MNNSVAFLGFRKAQMIWSFRDDSDIHVTQAARSLSVWPRHLEMGGRGAPPHLGEFDSSFFTYCTVEMFTGNIKIEKITSKNNIYF